MNQVKGMRHKLSRRNFLKLGAAAGVTLTGGYVLSEFAPWLNYDQEAEQVRRLFAGDVSGSAKLRELVRYATLAANGHNTQPWKFGIQENAIDIYPDYGRHLPVVDPDNRELWISLGCALENLLVAARATGYTTEVAYPDAEDVIRVHLLADTAQEDALFNAIPLRQTTRSEYNGQQVEAEKLDQLVNLPREAGVTLQFITHPDQTEMVLEYVNEGNRQQYADKAFVDELITWLRFNRKEAFGSLDGLYTRSSGNPEIPRLIGQVFVAGTDPQQQADTDVRKLRSSPHALVITSAAEDKSTWVRTGQVYERLALTMTALGIQSAFLNQPIEVADLRSQFQSAMGLGESLPQLLLRFGYGNLLPKSLRRPVENVLV